jgi:hypothetical protein
MCDPSRDFSVFVVPPDCPMSTPVASRERGSKEEDSFDFDFGASAFRLSPESMPLLKLEDVWKDGRIESVGG